MDDWFFRCFGIDIFQIWCHAQRSIFLCVGIIACKLSGLDQLKWPTMIAHIIYILWRSFWCKFLSERWMNKERVQSIRFHYSLRASSFNKSNKFSSVKMIHRFHGAISLSQIYISHLHVSCLVLFALSYLKFNGRLIQWQCKK